MKFKYNDGGRKDAGFKGDTGDCVVRAITIATGLDYKYIYNTLTEYQKEYHLKSRSKYSKKLVAKGKHTTVREGVMRGVYEKYMIELGWKWIPTMKIGQGCTTHLKSTELPKGNVVARISKHMVAVVDGVIHDTYDPSREETRCVYGYFVKE